MSITITGKFESPLSARQAALRLKRRGYLVSDPKRNSGVIPPEPLVVAHPYGAVGGNTPGNGLLSSLPIMAGNGVMIHRESDYNSSVLSVLTDDTHTGDVKALMESLGAKIL